MLKIKLFRLFLFLFLLKSVDAYSDDLPLVEIQHWWGSYGELSALNEIEQAVLNNGGAFEASKVSRIKYIENLVEQSSLGYLPGAAHWLGGKESDTLKKQNIIVYVPSKLNGKFLKSFLHKEVYEDISDGDNILSLPVGVHLQNRAYYNKRIYDELKLKPPGSWSEFIEQAKVIKAAGYTPLALPSNVSRAWQMRNLIDSIMIGHYGGDFFKNFYDEKKSIGGLRDRLVNVFDFLLSLKKYSSDSHSNNKWNENIRALAQGEAAAYFLGDYSKGELIAKEKLIPGKDFYCDFAPGNAGVHIYGIDSFALMNVKDKRLLEGQSLLVKTVLDPKIQAAYIAKKGGIPVRKDVVPKSLDVCSTKSYAAWLDPNTIRLPYAGGYSKARLAIMQKLAVELWNESSPNVEEMVDKIITAFNSLNTK